MTVLHQPITQNISSIEIEQRPALTLTTATMKTMPIKNYAEFYRFYLTEHQDLNCRRLHFVGSSLGLVAISMAIKKRQKRYLAYGILAGYACAWLGHFGFEKNKPASFKQPIYSFISDWRMYYHIVTGQISLFKQSNDRFPYKLNV